MSLLQPRKALSPLLEGLSRTTGRWFERRLVGAFRRRSEARRALGQSTREVVRELLLRGCGDDEIRALLHDIVEDVARNLGVSGSSIISGAPRCADILATVNSHANDELRRHRDFSERTRDQLQTAEL
jgi:hypothetical protein